MIKKLVLLFIAVFAIQSYAQNRTSSPYSYYGIGSLKFKGSVENRSMGGLGVYKDSIHVNFKNPATFGGENLISYKEESRPVKFTVAGSYNSSTSESSTGSSNASNTTFDYLAMAFPVGKLGVGFGLLPYTNVGYDFESVSSTGQPDYRYVGEGGINKVFLSAGYQINKAFSVGLKADYNFGKLENDVINILYDGSGQPLQNVTKESNDAVIRGLNTVLGVHYQEMITDKLQLQGSLTYTPKSKLNSENTRDLSSVTIDSETGATTSTQSSLSIDLEASNLENTTLILPAEFSLGAGIGAPRKWFAGIEYTGKKASQFSNPIRENTNVAYSDGSKIAVGGFYIPKYNSFSGYWKKATYRAGFSFEDTGLSVNDQSIKEFGMSFGVGLPVGKLFSNVNLGIEVGQRGTTNANLVKENFANFQLSLSLNDRWFAKKKYD